MIFIDDTAICALSTPVGNGAIALIRVSGEKAFSICQQILKFSKNGKNLSDQKTATVHFGHIVDGGEIVDEVLASVFKKPHSYTGENMVEISCHGSRYIQQKIMELLLKNGARLAEPGEFTFRAFKNNKLDLSQAEAVADLIASNSKESHRIAMSQMRGGFAKDLDKLREKLVHFISLIELELDFSEEDVEFADRDELKKLINEIIEKIKRLKNSFQYGNAIKNGIPVAIVGKPNVGKSTLLNTILNEEKAIVSEIPGTTRDAIEDAVVLDGILFRFIDTAGLRSTSDKIETLGIERTYENIKKAIIILLMVDPTESTKSIIQQSGKIKDSLESNQELIVLVNKIDEIETQTLEVLLKSSDLKNLNVFPISAKKKLNLKKIIQNIVQIIQDKQYSESDNIVSNIRHYEALTAAYEAGLRIVNGLDNGLTTDLIAQDIRHMLHYIGSITGEITTDEVLGNIFKNFCIGK